MSTEPPRRKVRPPRKVGRDLFLFLAGVGLTVNEALWHHGPERPTLLLVFAAMMGLPVVLRADEKRQPKGD